MISGTDVSTETVSAIAAFVREKVVPLEPMFLGGSLVSIERDLARVRAEVRRNGWWAPQAAAELGGMGLRLTAFARVSEALGYSPLGHLAFGAQAPDAGNIEILHAFGTEDQKERFLAPLVAGEIRSCFAMTEPDHAGSNPTTIATSAELVGSHYRVRGHKWFTTGADGAAFAIVMAVTDPGAPSAYQRASMVIVPCDTPGFDLVRNISVMGDTGSGWASHAEIRFHACEVPAGNLLGGAGEGFAIAQQRLGPGRIHHCMRWIGVAERAFEAMCLRAGSRDLGRGPLAGQQSVQFAIAESRAEIDAARLMVLDAARQIEEQGVKGARVAISTIKFYTSGIMLRVIDRAIQIHGALGMTDDTVLAFLYRHERAARIYDGPDEVHKKLVAREVLRGFGVTG